MSQRALPDRRQNVTHKVTIGGSKIYLTVGFYDEASSEVGEIFIAMERTGSERRWLMDEVARLASKLLQHGCDLETMAEGWVGTKGSPSGPVQGDAQIKNCSSVLDYVAKHLLVHYCDREDLAHIKKEVR